MSLIIGNGVCITYNETEVECPICSFRFDSVEKASKSKLPIFKMKCPACKSLIGISIPIFGGTTKCFEWNKPKTREDNQLITITPNRINGKIVTEENNKTSFDSDEPEDVLLV